MIELNLHITIKSEFAEGVASELARLGAAMSSGLGVGPQPSTTAEHPIEAGPAPAAAEAETPAGGRYAGGGAPTRLTRRSRSRRRPSPMAQSIAPQSSRA